MLFRQRRTDAISPLRFLTSAAIGLLCLWAVSACRDAAQSTPAQQVEPPNTATVSATATGLPEIGKLFSWTISQKVAGFSHSADIMPTEPFLASGHAVALPRASSDLVARVNSLAYQFGKNPDGATKKNNTIDDYMAHNQVTGLLIIKDGAIVTERYAMGLDERTVWDSKSAGKSVVSTLIGAAVKDGFIKSLDDPVDRYVPEMTGTAYEGVTLRNLLRMSSGVKWNENYLDPKSDIDTDVACMASRVANCTLNHLKSLKRARRFRIGPQVPQGTVWHYSTGDAFISGLVVQRATGMSLAKYLQLKIWQPYGMEANGVWWLDAPGGVGSGGGGFNATLRDYGRFGLFVMNNGVLADGTHVLPDTWMRDATTYTAEAVVPKFGPYGVYGYMWWHYPAHDDNLNDPGPLVTGIAAPLPYTTVNAGMPAADREKAMIASLGRGGDAGDWTFSAVGVYGQMIAVNPRENLVVVQWAVWDKPSPSCCNKSSPIFDARDQYDERAVFVNAVTKVLH